MSRTRVAWTAEELQQVTAKAVSFGPPENGDSEEIWRRMQEDLPSNRRRPFDPRWMAIINKERRSPKKHAAPAAAPATAAAAGTEPEPPAVEEVAAVAEPVAGNNLLAPLVENATAALLEVANRVLYDAKLRTAIRDLIKEAIAPESKEEMETGVLWRAPIAGREDRKRIVIAAGGIFANNASSVLRPLMRFYDMRLWNSRKEHAAKLRQILEGANVAVIVTNSISHEGASTCRAWSRAGKGKLVQYTKNVNGLLEDLPGLIGDELKIATKPAEAS